METAPFCPRDRKVVSALLWSALVLRLGFVLFAHSPRDFVFSDMQSYHQVAYDLLQGRVSPWHAFRPVGYSMLLALLYALSDGSRTLVGVVQAVLAALLVPLTARLARGVGARPVTALASAFVVAFSVPLTLYSGLLLTEVPAAFFLILGIVSALERGRAASKGRIVLMASGASLGVAVALRPNLLAVVLPIALFMLIRVLSGARVVPRALFVLGLTLPMVCVAAYNTHALGRPAGLSTNAGVNFYLNFADVRSLHYQGPYGGYWLSPVPNGVEHTRQELTDVPFFEERHYYHLGLEYVREHPYALVDALDNLVEAAGLGKQLYWPGWPGHEALMRGYARTFFGFVLLPALLLLAAMALARVRRALSPEALVLAVSCLLGLMPMYLFLGDPRVRVPMDPLLVVLAGLAIQRVVARLVGGQSDVR